MLGFYFNNVSHSLPPLPKEQGLRGEVKKPGHQPRPGLRHAGQSIAMKI